ncbi:MAG TPA: hypothetical protein VNC22_18665 [Sporichthya sp.]|nr:hypothetical protein [Sporichthya sp.]
MTVSEMQSDAHPAVEVLTDGQALSRKRGKLDEAFSEDGWIALSEELLGFRPRLRYAAK